MSVPKPTCRNFVDLEGQRFGRLLVVEYVGFSGPDKKGWLCRCNCGNTTTVPGSKLRSGHTTSCGCYRQEVLLRIGAENRTHGHSSAREYQAWQRLRGRCHNPKNRSYANYGGRGIQVCERYNSSFEAFLEDVGSKPSPELSIDRENNDGHYSCGKCPECLANGWPFNLRWANDYQQGNNRRIVVRYEFDGKFLSIPEWSRLIRIGRTTIHKRLAQGWTIEQALTTPVGLQGRKRS
jgi:hypothetical protein